MQPTETWPFPQQNLRNPLFVNLTSEALTGDTSCSSSRTRKRQSVQQLVCHFDTHYGLKSTSNPIRLSSTPALPTPTLLYSLPVPLTPNYLSPDLAACRSRCLWGRGLAAQTPDFALLMRHTRQNGIRNCRSAQEHQTGVCMPTLFLESETKTPHQRSLLGRELESYVKSSSDGYSPPNRGT